MPTIKQMVRDALLTSLAAPAIAEAGDINSGITLLKRSVVGYLNSYHPAPKEVIAPYLGKSVRWLYRMMEPIEQVEVEDPQADRLQKLIFLQMRRVAPEYMPISELHSYLRRCRLRYPRSILEDLLGFYVSLGFLEISPEDPTLYRASERLTQTSTRPFRERRSLLEQRASYFYPLAESFIREQPGSMLEVFTAELADDKMDIAAQEIDQEIQRILTKYSVPDGDSTPRSTLATLVLTGKR